MNTNDIVVGKKYHNQLTNNIYLGIGMRKLYTENEFVHKHLVTIESDDPDAIGLMVQEGDNAQPEFWDFFEEYDPENASKIFFCK